ncbi:MAG TPA: hypothetical protein PK402_08125 [Tepidisphaeraceae bacterium]|nr:hypothetical protein [Tepidisphaeraceae bacterium]
MSERPVRKREGTRKSENLARSSSVNRHTLLSVEWDVKLDCRYWNLAISYQ